MILQYKCPNCGADMIYDSHSGMLSCQSCGTSMNIEQMPKSSTGSTTNGDSYREEGADADDINEEYGDFEEFETHTGSGTFYENEAVHYHCNNCGAELITNPDTTATTCSFCGSPMVLGDRLTGSMAPAKVLPFCISKEQAQAAFKKWCKKGRLTPRGFMNADRIKSITGMYVPFWLYDANGRGEIQATATKVRHYTRGDYRYTETRYYDIYRKVDLLFEKIPVDASEKMDDTLMDKLEPFPYDNLKEFNAPYLSGYIAEKYNYTDRQLFPRLQAKTESFVDSFIRNSISGYTSVTYNHSWIDIKQRNADYTLLPVWLVCYDYNQSEHIFAMNGQTGKVVGKPPISKQKVFLWFTGLTIAFFPIVFLILTTIMGGS
ncbi:TFIIB-type zinc ribbon-containing protein [Anaeromicropila populeti]|uniref:Replication restart DNA helicase PriA n=1 Tax=Anaeromicropila populeti TaxID=37658 RepID=A0A1I6IAK6_9FIRM|nr:TFIIB-type zinc ribbon-containing protein [Anaeromicropila populeti]SFR63805.1 hypothetical protein SAMN05661086_00630 [Anaeromicropila populeti]